MSNQPYSVPNVQEDSISCLSWCPSKDFLAAGSWNNECRVWEVQKNQNNFNAIGRISFKIDAPILSCDFSADGKIFVGGCDNAISFVQINQNSQPQIVGKHEQPVKCVKYFNSKNFLISGSWDKKISMWDIRTKQSQGSFTLPDKCYTMDITQNENNFVVGCAQRHVAIFDIRYPTKPQISDSPLRHQTRCITCFPDNSGWAIGSIEGRVSIRYFTEGSGKKNFSFKCHRVTKQNELPQVYSVNSISFHPKKSVFATAGSDGCVYFWDKDEKCRLKSFEANQTISACAFNKTDGECFAYAVSYDWSKGPKYYKKDEKSQILLRYEQFEKSASNYF